MKTFHLVCVFTLSSWLCFSQAGDSEVERKLNLSLSYTLLPEEYNVNRKKQPTEPYLLFEHTLNVNLVYSLSKRWRVGYQHLFIWETGREISTGYYNIGGVLGQYSFYRNDRYNIYAETSLNRGNFCTCESSSQFITVPYKRNDLYYLGLGIGFDYRLNKDFSAEFGFYNYNIFNDIPMKYNHTQYIIGLVYHLPFFSKQKTGVEAPQPIKEKKKKTEYYVSDYRWNFGLSSSGMISSFYLRDSNNTVLRAYILEFSPRVGYFITQKFELGAAFTYGEQGSRDNLIPSGVTRELSYFARYYFRTHKNRYAIGHLRLNPFVEFEHVFTNKLFSRQLDHNFSPTLSYQYLNPKFGSRFRVYDHLYLVLAYQARLSWEGDYVFPFNVGGFIGFEYSL